MNTAKVSANDAKSQLLSVPFEVIMQYLKQYSISNNITPKKCTISYTWPSSSDEQDQHCKVLRLASDLRDVGVVVKMDLFQVDATCNFTRCLVDWIEESDAVLMMGSPSYKKRSEDSTTPTKKEVEALATKRKQDSESVIPVLMAGRFVDGFPPGYIETLGARITSLENYYTEVPSIAFKMLNLHKDKEVLDKIMEYRKSVESIMASTFVDNDIEQARLRVVAQTMFWRAQLITYKIKFTRDQLEVLDSRLAVCDAAIYKYCKEVMNGSDPISVPTDISPSASTSLEARLQEFLRGHKLVLLLQAPPGSGKSQATHYLAQLAWKEKEWIPIFLDLENVKEEEGKRCIENVLQQHITGFDFDMIELARSRHSFLLVVEGFDSCAMESNLYVKWNLARWKGKAVFTCDSSYLAPCIQSPFYFMPSDGPRPDPKGLQIISFVSSNVSTSKITKIQPTGAVPSVGTKQADVPKQVTSNPEEVKQKQYLQGYLLMQRDLVTPTFKSFLHKLQLLQGTPQPNTKAFISYAWPSDRSDCVSLQERLVQIVEDMSEAGIEVLLDVLRLSMGTNVNEFMQCGINDSSAILWIGTPRLKERINFQDKIPNPATFECLKIIEKAQIQPKCLHPLWFDGGNISSAFPDSHLNVASNPIDFRDEREYFAKLPLLVAQILQIELSTLFSSSYVAYCQELDQFRTKITNAAVWARWAAAEADKQQESARKIEALVKCLPENYKSDQQGVREVELRLLEGELEHQRDLATDSNSLLYKSLEFYIPLNGGTQPNTAPDKYFSVEKRALEFLTHPINDARLMLVIADAGSGKSMLGRYLEQFMWQHWNGKSGIPLFISLARSPNPFKGLVETELLARGFSYSTIKNLQKKSILFILDGLDEISLLSMPPTGILGSNNLLQDWPQSRFILTSRTHYLPDLAKRMNTSYQQHLTQGQTNIDEIYLMLFNKSQIQLFLERFSASPLADWPTATRYWDLINTIPGLLQLSKTPFILSLLVSALPRLSSTRMEGDSEVKKVDVYRTFTEQFSEREMWKQLTFGKLPLKGDWMENWMQLAEKIAQELFTKSVTQALFNGEAEYEYLRGCPVQKSGNTISFIHKSVQEYFTASLWIRKLNSANPVEVTSVLGARLVTTETGVLDFLIQSYAKSYEKLLLELVFASRLSPTLSASFNSNKMTTIAAANAITILNAARFNFSHNDFSNIRIPGANLDNLLAHETIFRGSDLREVSLRQAWLLDSDLGGCLMESIQFGQYPGLKSCKLFAMVAEDDNLAAREIGVIAWDAVTGIDPKVRVSLVKATCCSSVSEGEAVCKYVYKMLIKSQNQASVFLGYIFVSDTTHVSGTKVFLKSHDKIFMNDFIPLGEINDKESEDKEDSQQIDLEVVVTDEITCVVYAGGRLIAGSVDHAVQMWDITTGKGPTVMRGHNGAVRCVAIGDGKVVSSDEGEILVWDLDSSQQIGQAIIPNEGCVDVFITDGRILSRGVKTVDLWDISRVQEDSRKFSIKGHIGGVNGRIAGIAIQEGKIISVGQDGLLCMWDLETGQLHKQIYLEREGADDSCSCITVSDDGKAWVGGKESVTVCDLFGSGESKIVAKTSISLGNLTWYKGKLVLTNKCLEVWSTGKNMKLLHSYHTLPQDGNFEAMRGRQLEVASYEYRVVDDKIVVNQGTYLKVWDINTKEKLLEKDLILSNTAMKAEGIVIFKGNVVLGQTSGHIQMYNITTGECVGDAIEAYKRRVVHLSFFDDERIVSVHSDGMVILWEMNLRRKVATIHLHDTIKSIVCSAPWIVVAIDRYVIRLQYDQEKEKIMMRSCFPETWRLKVGGCVVEGASGLSEQDKLLIKQLDKPSSELKREEKRLQQLENEAKRREQRRIEWINDRISYAEQLNNVQRENQPNQQYCTIQ